METTEFLSPIFPTECGKVMFSTVSVCSQGAPHLHPIILPLVSCPFWGYPQPGQNRGEGYPGGRVPPGEVSTKGTPGWAPPVLGWGTPPARTTEGVLAMWQMVCPKTFNKKTCCQHTGYVMQLHYHLCISAVRHLVNNETST